MNGVQGQPLSAAATTATQIVLTDIDFHENKNWFPKVISGTIKFGVGAAAAAANHGFTSSDVIPPFSCRNGELYCDQAADADTFVITCTP